MERTNLSVGDVINQMEIGEYAIIVRKMKKYVSSKGHLIMSPPSALYWDKNDDNILKSTSNNLEVLIGKTDEIEGHKYKIVSEEEYLEYRKNFEY